MSDSNKPVEPTVKKVEPKAKAPDVLLSSVDPAAAKKPLPPDALDGVDQAGLPEGKVSAAVAAAVVTQREWEQEQAELAAIPDPNKK